MVSNLSMIVLVHFHYISKLRGIFAISWNSLWEGWTWIWRYECPRSSIIMWKSYSLMSHVYHWWRSSCLSKLNLSASDNTKIQIFYVNPNFVSCTMRENTRKKADKFVQSGEYTRNRIALNFNTLNTLANYSHDSALLCNYYIFQLHPLITS